MSESEEKKTVVELMRGQLADPLHEKTMWDGRQVDPLLQWMVDDSNRSANQHPVTLTVGGNLISGLLVSADSYFEQLAVEFSAHFETENGSADIVKKQILGFKLNLFESEDETPPAQFIHLKNAEVFTSGGRPIVSGGSLWRGKISSIDGFSAHRLVVNAVNNG